MNHIKIELENGLPYISMEYENLEAFRDLIFSILSPNASELFFVTIENSLIKESKTDELNIIRFIKDAVENNKINFKQNKGDIFFTNPGSFQ